MKIKFLTTTAILAMLTLSSCSNDEESTTGLASGTIGGNITANTSYAKGNYTLDGALVVKNGATLTIAAGTTITAKDDDATTDYIMVEKGGKIMAEGTAAEPIIMTAASKIKGKWAGIVIFGDAPIVTTAGATTGTAEVGSAISYGGSNATDNSGSLKYVQVLYAGAKIGDGTQEFNGFSFYSVGSGTTLQNLVSAYGNDDGFEWYGGTVSATNLISYGNSDDSFDWEGGWKGQANSNWFAYQTGTGNFGMEIEANSQNNAFWPKISAITLKRNAGTVTEGGASAAEYDAIQFKKEGNGEFTNVKIAGYNGASATGVRIQDANTNTNQVNGNKIVLKEMNITTTTTNYAGAGVVVVAFPVANFTTDNAATGATFTAGAWTIVEGVNTLANL